MKKTLLLISILSLFLLSSCKNEKTDSTENLTIENLKKTNDLFSFGDIHKGNFTSKSNYFNYSIVLDASNKTNNTFEKTIVEADLKLILQNNNVLSAKDTDKVLNLGSIEKITFWKPNQTKVIGKNKELYTQSLPNHFKEYPIKQVVLVLKLTASDIVNKTEETVVHNIDITEDWKNFLLTKPSTTVSNNKSNQNKISNNIVLEDDIEKSKKKEGDLLSKFYKQEPSENEETSSFSKRKVIYKETVENRCNEAGVVVVKVTVNRKGEVIDALAGIKGTTNQSECLLKISKEAALKTKWEAKQSASEEQVGSVIYNFKLN